MSKILFLAGIHGVGKSTLAEFLSHETGMEHFSSSELIKAHKKAPIDFERTVIDPEDNQSFLLNALDRVLSEHESIILDGHFTLWENDNVYSVPTSLFEAMPIAGIILLEEEPSEICSRLAIRDSRQWHVDDIDLKQKEEIKRAQEVSQHLKVPLLSSSEFKNNSLPIWIEACFS